ncbi:hypothetical protein J5571_04085 [Streptococcus suis]|nr:hypothetical protein [Streptococcus suis]MBL6504230.1 hypothetical protein [Streptococcus suis]MBM0240714.1 hypothetical protein [Streptococcus suis]MBM7204812.1 hypothetical protein [Streptococcus suis]MBM7282879.1 hypothetical protein [Streptococcus suis]
MIRKKFVFIRRLKRDTVIIRDDAGGHVYKDDRSQNRGPHFNDIGGNHYDY